MCVYVSLLYFYHFFWCVCGKNVDQPPPLSNVYFNYGFHCLFPAFVQLFSQTNCNSPIQNSAICQPNSVYPAYFCFVLFFWSFSLFQFSLSLFFTLPPSALSSLLGSVSSFLRCVALDLSLGSSLLSLSS